MDTDGRCQCEKCGQSFSDAGTFASHSCSGRKTQLGNYKCSKRKLSSNPGAASSSPEEEQPERPTHNIKRVRKNIERDEHSATDAAPSPSKDYLAVGSEHIFRTNTCPKCRRCFKLRSHLQEHLHLHFPDQSLQCPTCERFFTSKSKLRLHRLREAGDKSHRCPLCEYSAVERNAVRRHLASVHAGEAAEVRDGQSFPCPTCGQSFGQSRRLKAHMKTHIVPAGCFQDGCSFRTSQRKDLLRHAADEHGVKAVGCRHHACGAVFQSRADMEAHYRTHLAYHCSQCQFSCSNKTLFLQHQRLGHPGSEELRCDFCSFVTFNPVEFERHVGHLHANEKIHRCSQCSYVTSHRRGLRRHMLMHSGEKPHKCSLCDFRCRDESYLSKHMLTHSGDKNFMCAECGYVTKWKHYLNVHMRKHAGDFRYQCDQCPYRSHRMDQLNSHKLRHQTKSLMCEICAYACKRKYELRNHMLAKHSAEDKQPAVYKCKYCTYSTCYRQALQNHENCKHTRLKEFRCALCCYSSFSSISLFLHKRKAHGYVPGDKAWLQDYAAKEKERNSAQFVQDFYNNPPEAPEQSGESEGAPLFQTEEPDPPGSTDQGTSRESGTVEAVDVFDVVSQEVVNEGVSDSPEFVNSPEEYCTLVLTTLSTSDYQTPSLQNEGDVCSNQTPNSPHLNGKASEKVEFSSAPTPPEAECHLDDDYEPLTETAEPEETHSDGGSMERDQMLESERRLKAMKKHDQDQAEAMVLEGRVQMLVVPTKAVYRCDKCSYVTSKESALKNHSQSRCHARIKEHRCQACGARFKQKRGLSSHLAKKCPTLCRKARTFVGVSDSCLAAKNGPTVQQESDHTEPPFHQQDTEGRASCSTNCKASSESEHQTNNTWREAPLQSLYAKKDGKFKCKLCDFSSVKVATVERHLSTCRNRENRTKELKETSAGANQTFSCSSCSFKCTQKRALESHQRKGCLGPGEVRCTKSQSSLRVRENRKAAAAGRLHCQSCAFTRKQQRCMKQHVALKHKGARPHRCQYCPFSTTRRYRLEEHQSLHTGVGRHACDACEKTFGAATKLRQHKSRIHDRQPTHFCPLCDFSGYTPVDVRRHDLRCHAGELRHACAHCHAEFSSEAALRNHCKRVHRLQARLSCTQCELTCSSEAALRSHQESEHAQVRCNTCQEAFKTKAGLELHQRTHLAHRCQLCPFASKTRRLLAQHLLSEHEGGASEDKPLRCSTCQFVCRHQLVLEQHLRSHGGKRLYKCTDCEYSTRNKQKITWHLRIHTGEKPYGCEQCSYTCTDPARLKLHMRVHQEEKKYLCPQCGYKCKWATQLKCHMTKHTGDKPHACDECDYRSSRADALRAHRDTQHCDLRPFVCEKCGKAFKTSFILKTHQRQHSDERPYACGRCHKAFRWPAGLRHHYLSHTKQQPFCCRRCSYRAKQRFQVVKHLQRHHPEVPVEQGVARDSEAGSLTLKEALQGTLEEAEPEEAEPEEAEPEEAEPEEGTGDE